MRVPLSGRAALVGDDLDQPGTSGRPIGSYEGPFGSDDCPFAPIHRTSEMDRAAGADDPDVIARSPRLEEAWDFAVGRARYVERDLLAVEPAVMEVPDEAVPACRASDRVEVVAALPPDTEDGLLAEARRLHSLEAPTVVPEHQASGARHQHGAFRQGLHPPEVSGRAGAQTSPRLPVEVKDERSVPLVRADGEDVPRGPAADREQRGGSSLARSCHSSSLAASGAPRSRRAWQVGPARAFGPAFDRQEEHQHERRERSDSAWSDLPSHGAGRS
jgi:hypothetical protein